MKYILDRVLLVIIAIVITIGSYFAICFYKDNFGNKSNGNVENKVTNVKSDTIFEIEKDLKENMKLYNVEYAKNDNVFILEFKEEEEKKMLSEFINSKSIPKIKLWQWWTYRTAQISRKAHTLNVLKKINVGFALLDPNTKNIIFHTENGKLSLADISIDIKNKFGIKNKDIVKHYLKKSSNKKFIPIVKHRQENIKNKIVSVYELNYWNSKEFKNIILGIIKKDKKSIEQWKSFIKKLKKQLRGVPQLETPTYFAVNALEDGYLLILKNSSVKYNFIDNLYKTKKWSD